MTSFLGARGFELKQSIAMGTWSMTSVLFTRNA